MRHGYISPAAILKDLEDAETSRLGQPSAHRISRRKALERRTGGARSRAVLRQEVSERLGRNILDDFRSPDFEENPLADESDRQESETCLPLMKSEKLDRSGLVKSPREADEPVDVSMEALLSLKALVHQHDPEKLGLSVDKFILTLGPTLWSSKSKGELSHLFMQIDTNSDGRISWDELVAFLLTHEQNSDVSSSNRFEPLALDKAQSIDAGALHASTITHLLHLPDKDRYLTLGMDSTMRLWHCRSLKHARTLPMAESGLATDAKYVPFSKRLVLTSAHGKLALYDAATLKVQHSWRLRVTGQSLCSLEQSSQPEWPNCLFVGDQAGFLHAFEWSALNSGRLSSRLELKLHTGWIERLEYLRDLGRLVSSSSDGLLQLSDLGRGTCSVRNSLSNPTGKPIRSFVWCAAHAMVATCGVERHIHWWSPSISRPLVTLYGHAAAVTNVCLDEAHHQLISRSVDHVVRVWDVRTHRCMQVIEPSIGHSAPVLLHDPINQCLVTAGRQPTALYSVCVPLSLNEPTTIEAESKDRRPSSRGVSLVGLVCNVGLNLGVTVDENSRVSSWRLSSGEASFSFEAMSQQPAAPDSVKTTAVAFDHSGRRLLTGAQDGRVRVFNFTTGKCLNECLPPPKCIRSKLSCEISVVLGIRHANHSFIIACGWSREVWFWPDQPDHSAYQIECCRVLRSHAEDILCACFSTPNMLATGGFDGVIMVWNLDSTAVKGRLLHERSSDTRESGSFEPLSSGSSISVDHLSFISLSRDKSVPLLLSAGGDNRIRCWCMSSLSLLFVFPLQPGEGACSGTHPISTLHWSDRSRTLLVGGSAGVIDVWNGSELEHIVRGSQSPARTPHRGKTAFSSQEVYDAFQPMMRWKAHSQAVVGVSVIVGDDLADDISPESQGCHLIVTAARNSSVRLWTCRGDFLGKFGSDHWRLITTGPFRAAPFMDHGEEPHVWDAAPLFDPGASGSSDSMFLTGLEAVAPLGAHRSAARPSAPNERALSSGSCADGADVRLPSTEREHLLDVRAQEGVQRALGSMSTHFAQHRGPRQALDSAMHQSMSAPVLPPMDSSIEEQGSMRSMERDRARVRARSRLSAKLAARNEDYNEAQTTASDVFLQAREKALRASKPQPRRLPVYELAPLQRHEQLRERLERLSTEALFADVNS